MPIKLKANNGNIDLKAPIKQVGGKVDSVNGMTGDVVLEIPSKTSDLANDSGFLTQIPDEYITETELDAKGYLTEHQSLADYAKKSEIPDVSGFITEIPDEYVTETELDAKGYLTEHQSLAEYAKKSDIPDVSDYVTDTELNTAISSAEERVDFKLGSYALKTEVPSVEGLASTQYVDEKVATKQDTLTAGNNITIVDGVISATGGSGGGEPDAYLKSASVSGNTLTLTNKDNTTVAFTPTGGSGGGSGGVSGYAFSSTQTLTDVDKAHLKEIYTNKNIYMTIDNLTVVRIMSFGTKRGFIVVNTNGATSNQVLVYTVNLDSSGNVISDTFALFMSYYLAGNNSALSGDIITSENWSQYISAGGGDWQYTSSSAESNLYNAKEMVLYWKDSNDIKRQSYLNFTANFNFEVGQTLGTGWTNDEIRLDADDTISHPSITYNGSSIVSSNCFIYFILYKT